MPRAAEILKTIETVRPENHLDLNQLDAEILCYLNHPTFDFRVRDNNDVIFVWENPSDPKSGRALYPSRIPRYTRSRNELQKIRPKPDDDGGWWSYEIHVYDSGSYIKFTRHRDFGMMYSPKLPTEELAELWAIIKAIEYERTKCRTS